MRNVLTTEAIIDPVTWSVVVSELYVVLVGDIMSNVASMSGNPGAGVGEVGLVVAIRGNVGAAVGIINV